jgi:hypothetical protein
VSAIKSLNDIFARKRQLNLGPSTDIPLSPMPDDTLQNAHSHHPFAVAGAVGITNSTPSESESTIN